MRIAALFTGTLIILFSGVVSADPLPSLPFGQYVRLNAGGKWQYGRLDYAGEDTLILRGGNFEGDGDDRVAMPVSTIQRMQTRTGLKSQTVVGFSIGGIIGVVGGAVAGAALCDPSATIAGGSPNCADAPIPEVVGGFIGGIVMGGLGALIGSAIKTDRWEEVPLDRLHGSVILQPGREFAGGLSIHF